MWGCSVVLNYEGMKSLFNVCTMGSQTLLKASIPLKIKAKRFHCVHTTPGNTDDQDKFEIINESSGGIE